MSHRSSQDRHETPVGVRYNPDRRFGSLQDRHGLYDVHNLPASEFEALMVAPGETVLDAADLQEMAWLWTELELDQLLSPKELAVIEMIVFGQLPLREAGVFLGKQFRKDGSSFSKSMVAKIRDSGLRKLRRLYATSEVP